MPRHDFPQAQLRQTPPRGRHGTPWHPLAHAGLHAPLLSGPATGASGRGGGLFGAPQPAGLGAEGQATRRNRVRWGCAAVGAMALIVALLLSQPACWAADCGHPTCSCSCSCAKGHGACDLNSSNRWWRCWWRTHPLFDIMVVEPRHPLSPGMGGFTPAFVWKEGSCDLFGSSCSSGGLYPIHPVSYPMFDGHTPVDVWTNGMCLTFGEGCTGGGALHVLPWTDAFEWWPLEEWISDTWSWTDDFWCDGSCGFFDVIVFPFKLIAFVLFAVVCGVGTVLEVIFCVLAKAVLLIAGVLGFLVCIILVAFCIILWVVVMVADILFMVVAALVFALELLIWAVIGLLGLIIWMLTMFASLLWWVIIAITWTVELAVSVIIWVLGVILWPVELVVMTMVAEFAYMCAWVNSMIVTLSAQPSACCTDRESSVYWISSLVIGLCGCIGGFVLRGKDKADLIFLGAAAPISMYCFSFWLSCVVQDRPQEAAFSVVICVSGIAGVLGFGYGRAKVAVQWWDQAACVVAWVMSVLMLIIGSVQISAVYTYDASWFADGSTNCSASDHSDVEYPSGCCTDRESSVYWISSLVIGLCGCIGGFVLRGKDKADMIFLGAAAPISMYCFSFWLSCVVQDRPQEAAFSVVICVSGIAGVLGFGYGRAKVAVQWWDQAACVVAWVMSVLMLIIGSVQISAVYTYDASWFADGSTNCSASDHSDVEYPSGCCTDRESSVYWISSLVIGLCGCIGGFVLRGKDKADLIFLGAAAPISMYCFSFWLSCVVQDRPQEAAFSVVICVSGIAGVLGFGYGRAKVAVQWWDQAACVVAWVMSVLMLIIGSVQISAVYTYDASWFADGSTNCSASDHSDVEYPSGCCTDRESSVYWISSLVIGLCGCIGGFVLRGKDKADLIFLGAAAPISMYCFSFWLSCVVQDRPQEAAFSVVICVSGIAGVLGFGYGRAKVAVQWWDQAACVVAWVMSVLMLIIGSVQISAVYTYDASWFADGSTNCSASDHSDVEYPSGCCTDRESSVYWISSLVIGLCGCIGGFVLRGKDKADMIFLGAAAPISMYCFSFWLSCVVQDRPQEAAFSVVICVSGIAGVLGFGYGRAKVAVQWWDQAACVVAWVMSVLMLIIGSVQISAVYTYDASWFADGSTNCSASDDTGYAGWFALPVVAACIAGLAFRLWRAWSASLSAAPPTLAAALLGVAGAVPGPTVGVSRPASPSRSPAAGGGGARAMAEHLFATTWAKTTAYTFESIVRVEEIHSPHLQRKYEAYKAQLPDDDVNRTSGMRSTVTDMRSVLNQHGVSLVGNEVLVFHGCSEAACHSISQQGFLRQYWKSATGNWQRFGPGFYFALDASKSHEYPLSEMQAKSKGKHTRKMLLCKVARGRVLKTHANMDSLQGAAPAGYDSIHGYAGGQGNLNYDEFVVFREEAIMPYAIVTYRYNKL